jgi:hypothetical protein
MSELDNLVAAQSSDRKFYISLDDGSTPEVTQAELQAKVNEGFNGHVLAHDDQDRSWKYPDAYGIAKQEAATPPPPAAPAAPPAPAAQEAAATAAPAAQATQAAPATQEAAPATQTTAVAVSKGDGLANLVADEAEALKYAQLLAPSKDARSLAEIANVPGDGSGMAHTFPFAQLKKGNWDTPQGSCTDEQQRYMPVGNRPYLAIYMKHRVGALGWTGDSGNGAPKWKYALPAAQLSADAAHAAAETMRIGSKIQFTPKAGKKKFDDLGRVTPELQVLVWTPQVGYHIISLQNFKPVEVSLKNLEKAEKEHPTYPVLFKVGTHEASRKNNRDDHEYNDWTEYTLEATFDTSAEGQAMRQEFLNYKDRDPAACLNPFANFSQASDYKGMSLTDVLNHLSKYDELFD